LPTGGEMFRILLLINDLAVADSVDSGTGDTGSGDSDSCALYSVRLPYADFEEDVCHTDSTTRMCLDWMPVGCPTWEDFFRSGGYRTFKCASGIVTYAASASYPEGESTSYYFDASGRVVGTRERMVSTIYCCDGKETYVHTIGTVGCPNPTEIFFEDSGVTEPPSNCGCSGNGGAAAAGLGLLLLARRWFKI
jgi:uncharacterized protein (TIGR03382 family)